MLSNLPEFSLLFHSNLTTPQFSPFSTWTFWITDYSWMKTDFQRSIIEAIIVKSPYQLIFYFRRHFNKFSFQVETLASIGSLCITFLLITLILKYALNLLMRLIQMSGSMRLRHPEMSSWKLKSNWSKLCERGEEK